VVDDHGPEFEAGKDRTHGDEDEGDAGERGREWQHRRDHGPDQGRKRCPDKRGKPKPEQSKPQPAPPVTTPPVETPPVEENPPQYTPPVEETPPTTTPPTTAPPVEQAPPTTAPPVVDTPDKPKVGTPVEAKRPTPRKEQPKKETPKAKKATRKAAKKAKATTTQPAAELAYTGATSDLLALVSMVLLLAGAGLVIGTRRKGVEQR
jgi:LPXTG-motif cell wall-anchored protein